MPQDKQCCDFCRNDYKYAEEFSCKNPKCPHCHIPTSPHLKTTVCGCGGDCKHQCDYYTSPKTATEEEMVNQLEKECFDTFLGGYTDNERELEIFRHGMGTVFNVLRGEKTLSKQFALGQQNGMRMVVREIKNTDYRLDINSGKFAFFEQLRNKYNL
jgi:hypothetical protein